MLKASQTPITIIDLESIIVDRERVDTRWGRSENSRDGES
jgi:hypothetical protein